MTESTPHALGPDTNRSPATWVRYRVLGWLCAAATIAYVHRNAIAIAESTIRNDLDLTFDQMGWVMTGFFITYALFQIPTAALGDRWGSRRALPVYSFLWSIATAATAWCTGFASLLITRLTSGMGQAGIFPCSANTISKWFPSVRWGSASGILASFMSIGALIATVLTGTLLTWLSWRVIYGLYLLPGLLWAILFFGWFRNLPEEHESVNDGELLVIREGAPRAVEISSEQPRTATPWLALLTSSAMWLICGQQFFRAAGYMFYTSWFPTFLQESRGVSIPKSGVLTALPLFAVVVGAPLGGAFIDWVYARTGSRRLSRQAVAAACMLAGAISIVGSYFIHDTLLAVLVISVGSFWGAFGGPAGYAITIDMGGKHIATVFSTMNMSGNIGAAAFPVVVARLVTVSDSWDYVLFVFAGVYVAAFLCWLLLNPNGTVFDKSIVRAVEYGVHEV